MSQPTQNPDFPSPTHSLRRAAGPLAAALTLARLFPHLPATVVEARGGKLAVFLHGADAAAFADWVDALGLEEDEPNEYLYSGDKLWRLRATGQYAEVQVVVSAYPANVSAVAA